MPTLMTIKAFFLKATLLSLSVFMLAYASHFTSQMDLLTLPPIMFIIFCACLAVFVLCHIFGILLGIEKVTRDYNAERTSKPSSVDGSTGKYK